MLALSGAASCEAPPFGATATEEGPLAVSSTIVGRDGGVGAALWGHVVFCYGDTVLSVPDAEGETWHHNSFSITEDLDASDGIDGFTEPVDEAGAPIYFVAPTPDEATFNEAHRGEDCEEEPCQARFAAWPGTMVYDEARDRALVFYGLIYAEPGDFNFRGVGQSIATWAGLDDLPERPEVAPGAEHPTLLFSEGEPPFGTAAIARDGDLYAFACDSDADGLSPPCLLAKVPLEDALDRSAWRFWDGGAWSEALDDATEVFAGAPSVTVAYNAYLGAFTAIYAEPLSNDVVIRTADALEGPWTDPRLLFVANKPDGSAYDSDAHPEYEEEGGRVQYVTFSRGTEGWFGSEIVVERVELP